VYYFPTRPSFGEAPEKPAPNNVTGEGTEKDDNILKRGEGKRNHKKRAEKKSTSGERKERVG